MDPVDQGTLCMLLLGLLMTLVATMYFTIRWIGKKRENAAPQKKPDLKRTFSRFSQVDEELVRICTAESVKYFHHTG